MLTTTFEKDLTFDYQAYLQNQHPNPLPSWQVVVEFQAPLQLMQEKIPPAYGTFTAISNGVRFETEYEDLVGLARYLVGLNIPFVIQQPAELRQAFQQLGEHLIQIAT